MSSKMMRVHMITDVVAYARHEPHHCLTPGLFKSYKRGDRKKLKQYAKYEISPDGKQYVEFKCFDPLGVDDMRVLQGVVALSGPNGIVLEPSPIDKETNQLRMKLVTEEEAINEDGRLLSSSLADLCKLIGLSGGGESNRLILASLERLHNVSVKLVTEENGRLCTRISRILSYSYSEVTKDYSEGRVKVAINPIIARSVVGDKRYIKINLAEVRALKTDAAVLIHQRLCGWIDIGKERSVSMEKLFEYVWHDATDITQDGIKYRRKTIRKAIEELRSIGWHINEKRTRDGVTFAVIRKESGKNIEVQDFMQSGGLELLSQVQ